MTKTFSFVTPQEAERRSKALESAGGSISRAARALGLTRSGLRSWLRTKKTQEHFARARDPEDADTARDSIPRDEEIEILQKELDDARNVVVREPITVASTPRDRKDDWVRVIIPDSHGMHISRSATAAFLADLATLNPDEIVMLGDHIDCGGFLAQHHAMGYVAETDTSYAEDVRATNDFLNAIQAASPKCSRIHYLEGNHECLHPHHQVMTARGWLPIADVTTTDLVAQLTPEFKVRWAYPQKTHAYDFDGELIGFESDSVAAMVTPNHRIAYVGRHSKDLKYRLAEEIFASPHGRADVPVVGQSGFPDLANISDDEIRLVAWILTDGNINAHIAINQSKPERVEEIRELLTRLNITFSEVVRSREVRPIDGVPVKSALPAHVFSVLADSRHYVARLLGITGWHYADRVEKCIPPWVEGLSDRQFNVFLDTIVAGDGSEVLTQGGSSRCVYGTERFLAHLQRLCVVHGIRASLRPRYRNGDHAYWVLNLSRREIATVTTDLVTRIPYVGKVYCLTMPEGNFFTRLDGKVHVTGNCRVEKWCVTQSLRNSKDSQFLLSVFGPEATLGLKQRGITYYRSSERYHNLPIPGTIKLGKCTFTHGISCGTHATHDHATRFGISVVHGHTHRSQSSIIRTVGGGVVGAWSPGCLCQLQPLYQATSPTSWSHGYGLQVVSRSGKFLHLNVPIIDGESLLSGLASR